jgi:catechol 2,3-dioxygenase-like lactoylglutathione lyase family enzyme
MKRSLLLFAGISLCCAALGAQAEEQPLATRVEHFFVASDEAQALFTFIKDTFQLPEVWPFKAYGGFSSGGLSLGNVVLEFALLSGRDSEAGKTQFQGIAFEPTGNAETTRLELTKRDIPHTRGRTSEPEAPSRQARVGWENVGLTDFPPRNKFVFFCDYKDREGVAQGRKAASAELAKRMGGPLGIVGAAEITVGVQDIEEARSKWSTLLAPSPRISDDAFVFASGPRIRLVRAESPGIQGIALSVRSLDEAEKFLKERGLILQDVGQIAISPQAIEGLSIRLVEADQAREPAHPLIGPGHGTAQGVDHVGIAVRDLKKTRDDYERVLGFNFMEIPPQSGEFVPYVIWFENGTYLELQPIAALPFIAKMFDYADGYSDFAEKYEGAVFMCLATSSARYAADHLKARNFQASLDEEDSVGNYVFISHEPSGEKHAFPLAIFLGEYAFNPGSPARFAARLEQGIMTHPNTARRLYSVWFAVRDLEASLKNIQDAGLDPGETREAKFLGAKGREVKAGNGCLLLLQSVDKTGILAKFLSDRHDGEIIGVSVEVSDVEKARSLIESRSGRKLERYNGFYGRSILIPPNMTHGVWLEMFQR